MPQSEEARLRKNERQRRYYQAHKAEIQARAKARGDNKKFYWKNPEKSREYARRWSSSEEAKNKQRQRARKRSGIDLATGETRKGDCPICLNYRKLLCDHDHTTGRIRGWICRNCNLALGMIGDTVQSAHRLRSYLVVQ